LFYSLLDQRPRLGHTQAADFDPRDRDALRQPIVPRSVVAPRHGYAGPRKDHEHDDEDEQDFPHGLPDVNTDADRFQAPPIWTFEIKSVLEMPPTTL
jgi:hypothetical protein